MPQAAAQVGQRKRKRYFTVEVEESSGGGGSSSSGEEEDVEADGTPAADDGENILEERVECGMALPDFVDL